jgi:hypothetical protein
MSPIVFVDEAAGSGTFFFYFFLFFSGFWSSGFSFSSWTAFGSDEWTRTDGIVSSGKN